MPENSLMVICPNPKCKREIEEPILLTIFSVTPPKKYKACPYCFAKLEQENPRQKKKISELRMNDAPREAQRIEHEDEEIEDISSDTEKEKDSGPNFFKRVKSLLPSGSRRRKEKKDEIKESEPELTSEEEQEPEKEIKKDYSNNYKKEDPKPKRSIKNDAPSGCPESFGYLANRQKDEPIPQGCLVCPKMVDCMLSPREE